MAKIIVLGSTGMLGCSLVPHLRDTGCEVITAGRNTVCDYTVDPACPRSLADLFATVRPDTVINLIAATDIDRCESDIPYACEANVTVPAAISRAAATSPGDGMHIIHMSTDHLYDGTGPHVEDDVSPVNVYSLTKYTGELLAAGPRTTILRTNFYGRSHASARSSFSDWVIDSLKSGRNITLFQDIIFSALTMQTLCRVIRKMIDLRICGTFNFGCRDSVSKAEFAIRFARELGLPVHTARLGRWADLSGKTRRPLDMSIDVSRFEKATGIQCPRMEEEIKLTAKEYLHV